jgi:formamidopyrimidine-DNA glycosylase
MEISEEEFLKKLEKKRGKIKAVLMDQSVLAGIGNVYADEILFQSRIHPESSADKLKEKELKAIFKNIKPVMETAIFYQGKRKSLPDNFIIPYRKKGEACPVCGGKIEMMRIGGRATYFCPFCQR